MFGSHLAVPCVNLSCPCVSSYLCLQTSSFFCFYWRQSILPSRNCWIFTCLLSSSQLTSRWLQKREKGRHHGSLTSLHALTLTWVPTPQSSLLCAFLRCSFPATPSWLRFLSLIKSHVLVKMFAYWVCFWVHPSYWPLGLLTWSSINLRWRRDTGFFSLSSAR